MVVSIYNGQTLSGVADYPLVSAVGLDPPSAVVSSLVMYGQDGAVQKPVRQNTRNIVLTFALVQNVEASRQHLYGLFKPKSTVTLRFETDTLDVLIDGVVDSVECPIFVQMEKMQVSLICGQPFFRSKTQETENHPMSAMTETFTFSASGDVPTWFTLAAQIQASTTSFTVSTVQDGKTKKLDFYYSAGFQIGDEISIDTTPGAKKATMKRGLTTTDLFPYMTTATEFFKVLGSTTFTVYGQSDVDIRWYPLYEGL